MEKETKGLRYRPVPCGATRAAGLAGQAAFPQMVMMQCAVEDCLLTAKFSTGDRIVSGAPWGASAECANPRKGVAYGIWPLAYVAQQGPECLFAALS